ncbi:hypothetical protein [Aulosira sp. FACHB-615]|uniref:hypothetical protein n=1 Tax=Aulosira sp. FACHB-615 TaxID=2692777 RepID=UPI001689A822|nr:hypothetical protein [Aulosira sp. FACHB-615]MBD2489044.1 hypothetical protein [Aulosira sp. FACHB-615]
MNQNQVKAIQSRLSSRGQKFTLGQIREHIAANYDDEELSQEQISEIVDKLSGSSEMVPAGAGELSNFQKKSLIKEIAVELNLNLSFEQIKDISQKMNWALSDRTSLKERIQSAMIAYIDYQVDQDLRQTDEMMQEVTTHLSQRLQESNQHFNNKASEFSQQINGAVEKFRTTEAEILDLFKVPS